MEKEIHQAGIGSQFLDVFFLSLTYLFIETILNLMRRLTKNALLMADLILMVALRDFNALAVVNRVSFWLIINLKI